MRRLAYPIVFTLTLSAAACSKAEQEYAAGAEALVSAADAADASAPAPAVSAAPTPERAGSKAAPPAEQSVAMLAYRHRYGVEAPAKAVRTMIAAHEAACQRAGPLVCQVVGATVEARGEDDVYGKLSMRAQPVWLADFRAGLAGEAKAAGGRLAQETTETEDLSTQIVDVEARLRAKTIMRDRLQTLLATRPGKIADLMEVERELAQAQGDIDSARALLAMMQKRVAMSRIDLTYGSKGVLAADGVFAPVGAAVNGVAGTVAAALAIVIQVLAALFVPGVLAGGVIAAILGFKRRRAGPKNALPQPAL